MVRIANFTLCVLHNLKKNFIWELFLFGEKFFTGQFGIYLLCSEFTYLQNPKTIPLTLSCSLLPTTSPVRRNQVVYFLNDS